MSFFLTFNFNLFSSVFFYKKKHCLAQLWPGRWCHCILGWHVFSAGMRECDNQPCRLTRQDMQAPLPPPELWQTPIGFCFWVGSHPPSWLATRPFENLAAHSPTSQCNPSKTNSSFTCDKATDPVQQNNRGTDSLP